MKSPQITRVFLLIVVSLLKVLTFSTRTIHHLPFLCSFIPPLPVGSLRFKKEPQRENYMKFLLQSSFPLITTELIHVFMTSTCFFLLLFSTTCQWKLPLKVIKDFPWTAETRMTFLFYQTALRRNCQETRWDQHLSRWWIRIWKNVILSKEVKGNLRDNCSWDLLSWHWYWRDIRCNDQMGPQKLKLCWLLIVPL